MKFVLTVLFATFAIFLSDAQAADRFLCLNEVGMAAFNHLSNRIEGSNEVQLNSGERSAVSGVQKTGQQVSMGVGDDFYRVTLSGRKILDGRIIGSKRWIVKVTTNIDTCQIKNVEFESEN